MSFLQDIASNNPVASLAETGSAPRSEPFRAKLNDAFIKKLRPSERPVGYSDKGTLIFAAPTGTTTSFIIWDSTQDSPRGFGVKVAKRKTYILRRKIAGKSIMSKIGDFSDFGHIDEARDKAREIAQAMENSGRNPNALKREQWTAELTVAGALERYRRHLVTRAQRPATVETLRVHGRVVRCFENWGWADRRLSELNGSEVEKKFLENKQPHVAANEQRFRWIERAVDWCIQASQFEMSSRSGSPKLQVNPFKIVSHHKHYRASSQVEIDREERGVRNPLKSSQDLGRFLEAAWSKKNSNDNETGVHYLMLMLLWGCRKSEHADLVWEEFLGDGDGRGLPRKTTSHVCLEASSEDGPYVFFHRTKNGRNHKLPIAPMTLNLLRRRQEAAAEEVVRRGFYAKSRKFVFPARNPSAKTGHYSDSTHLLNELREEIGAQRLTPHDLRRSFGALMTEVDVPDAIKKRFLNHASSDVTDIYTRAEWRLLREWMERIEQAFLTKAPNVYNALKPTDWPPLPAPAPHECRPPAPRSGRPRKNNLASSTAA